MILNRRSLLKFGLSSAGLLLGGFESSLAALDKAPNRKRLVVVNLMGGADPLTFFPPFDDDEYHRLRPQLAVAKKDCLKLDSRFGLNPRLSPLHSLWKEGELGIIHQFGVPDCDRSHIQAISFMEFGYVQGQAKPEMGLLSRAIAERTKISGELNRAFVIQPSVPMMLSGMGGVTAMTSIEDLIGTFGNSDVLSSALSLYPSSAKTGVVREGKILLELIADLRKKFELSSASNGARDKADFKFRLNEVARLMKADVPFGIAYLGYLGWDTHAHQSVMMPVRMKSLADGLLEFRNQLQKSGHWNDTVVLVVTEFGRSVKENGSVGTEHGRGSAALVLGGALKSGVGGRILHDIKSLKPEDLNEGRDLAVRHDFRDVFSELFVSQLGIDKDRLPEIFPGHEFKKIGLFTLR